MQVRGRNWASCPPPNCYRITDAEVVSAGSSWLTTRLWTRVTCERAYCTFCVGLTRSRHIAAASVVTHVRFTSNDVGKRRDHCASLNLRLHHVCLGDRRGRWSDYSLAACSGLGCRWRDAPRAPRRLNWTRPILATSLKTGRPSSRKLQMLRKNYHAAKRGSSLCCTAYAAASATAAWPLASSDTDGLRLGRWMQVHLRHSYCWR